MATSNTLGSDNLEGQQSFYNEIFVLINVTLISGA
jgi:hypothetical protein